VAVQFRQTEITLQQATESVLNQVQPLGGRGGIIAIGADGQVALPFQTMLMYRGLWQNGAISTGIGNETYS
jgi:isoaspartyl peptidase/L-asparaginase-like protein (Ntn-hydrolase superfamily)